MIPKEFRQWHKETHITTDIVSYRLNCPMYFFWQIEMVYYAMLMPLGQNASSGNHFALALDGVGPIDNRPSIN